MRCVHLDFHTSPFIDGVGEKFDKKKLLEISENVIDNFKFENEIDY